MTRKELEHMVPVFNDSIELGNYIADIERKISDLNGLIAIAKYKIACSKISSGSIVRDTYDQKIYEVEYEIEEFDPSSTGYPFIHCKGISCVPLTWEGETHANVYLKCYPMTKDMKRRKKESSSYIDADRLEIINYAKHTELEDAKPTTLIID